MLLNILGELFMKKHDDWHEKFTNDLSDFLEKELKIEKGKN